MATFLISLITGIAAGALTARTIVKRELAARDAQQQVPAVPPTAVPPVPAPLPVAAPPPTAPAPTPVAKSPEPAPAPPDEMTPEILTVLTAAVAAFLGKRARIRSIRPATGGASVWAQQGRVFVQASHNLPVHH